MTRTDFKYIIKTFHPTTLICKSCPWKLLQHILGWRASFIQAPNLYIVTVDRPLKLSFTS
jgi:hypothetical protein